MKSYIQTIKQFDINLRIFLLATAFHGFVFFGIYTLLLNLYLLRLGYGPEFIGLANGVAPLVLAVGSIPAGLLSKRIGNRKGLMIGYFFIAVGFGLLPLSGFLPAQMQDGWIVGTYAFSWLSGALVVVNYSPYIMGATVEKERNHAFAVQSAMFPLAGFLGNIVGGFLPSFFANFSGLTLDSAVPYRNALLLGAFIYLIPSIVMWCTAEIKPAAQAKQVETVSNTSSKPPYRIMALVALVSLLIVTGDWSIQLYFNVYLDSVLAVPTALIGSISAAARLLGLTAFLSPLVMSRFGRRKTILWTISAGGLAFFPLILIGHWVTAAATFMALIAVTSILNPAYNLFSQNTVKPEWRTTIASVISATTGLAIAITAFGGSAIIVAFGFRTMFAIGASLIILAAVIFRVCFSLENQTTDLPVAQSAFSDA